MYEIEVEEINKRIVKNIDVILKKKKRLKKEFENAIGVSAGYISKITKLSQQSNFPGLNILLNIANELEVSIESLLFFDFSKDCYYREEEIKNDFINHIIRDTKEHKIIWEYDDDTFDLREAVEEFYSCSRLNKFIGESDVITDIDITKRFNTCINNSIEAELYVYRLQSDNSEKLHTTILLHVVGRKSEGDIAIECPDELFYIIESSVVDKREVIIYNEMRKYITSRRNI